MFSHFQLSPLVGTSPICTLSETIFEYWSVTERIHVTYTSNIQQCVELDTLIHKFL